MIRVLVVDDHAVVRAGLRMLLERSQSIEIVGEAADGAAAVDAVAALAPDVVLMDLSMPGVDGIEATARITAAHPGVAVVVLTTFADRAHVGGAIEAGAVGFLLKDADPGTLTEAISAAARGEAPLDPRAAAALLGRRSEVGRRASATGTTTGAEGPGPSGEPVTSLTAREREVLGLLAEGLSNRLIARRLGIAEKTVKAHLTSIFAQLGVTDRVQAALWWQRQTGA